MRRCSYTRSYKILGEKKKNVVAGLVGGKFTTICFIKITLSEFSTSTILVISLFVAKLKKMNKTKFRKYILKIS